MHGVSGRYGVFAESGMADARYEALEAALSLGANTVVFEPFSTVYGSTSVHGNAL